MNFKPGDKVYFKTDKEYHKAYSGFGTIRQVREVLTGGYYIDVIEYNSADVRVTQDGIIVSPAEGGIIIPEELYNSPLYKLMQE